MEKQRVEGTDVAAQLAKKRPSRRRPRKVRHRVLQTLFPELISLHQFLLRTFSQAEGICTSAFLLSGDTPSYHKLLTGTLVAIPDGAPPPPASPSTGPGMTQSGIIYHVLEFLFNTSAHTKNILAKGYGPHRAGLGHGIRSVYGVENYFPNTLVNFVTSKDFSTLLERIGEGLMKYLLLHAMMFYPLPNNCYFQACGPMSFTDYCAAFYRAAPRPGPLPRGLTSARRTKPLLLTSARHETGQQPTPSPTPPPKKKKKEKKNKKPALQHKSTFGTTKDQSAKTTASSGSAEQKEGSKRKKKQKAKTRLSIWRRRKLHKLQKAPETQPGQNSELMEQPTQSSNEKESTQTNGEKDVHNTVTMPDKQAAGSKASTAQQVGKKHRDSSKFSRSRIFYCNTTTHIGLPHKHILSQSEPSKRGAQKLIRAIFCDPELPPSLDKPLKDSRGGVRNSNNPQYEQKRKEKDMKGSRDDAKEEGKKIKKRKEKRIPPRLRGLIPLFQRMIRRHKKKNYHRPLAKFCPLPTELQVANQDHAPELRPKREDDEDGKVDIHIPALDQPDGQPPSDDTIWIRDDDGYATQDEEASETEGGDKKKKRKRIKVEREVKKEKEETPSTTIPSVTVDAPGDSTTHPQSHQQAKRKRNTMANRQPSEQKRRKGMVPDIEEEDQKQKEVGTVKMEPPRRKRKYDALRGGGDPSNMMVDGGENRRKKQQRRKWRERRRRLGELKSVGSLLPHYVPHDKVASFLRAVCAYIIPNEMWGSEHNKSVFFNNITHIVQLRRHEQFHLEEAMRGMKVSDVPWLNGSTKKSARDTLTESRKKTELLQKWIYWLFEKFIIPLIRMHFYVTESGSYGQVVFYYRKPVWQAISTIAMNSLATLTAIPVATAQEIVSSKDRPFGFSYLRFLPKQGGTRPICNLSRTPTRCSPVTQGAKLHENGKTYSINSNLKNLFHVLAYEKETHPGAFGGSVFSREDIYKHLAGFIKSIKESSICQSNNNAGYGGAVGGPGEQMGDRGSLPRLYIVAVDVKGSFDTINQQKLLQVVESLGIEGNEYGILPYARHVWVSTQGHIKVAWKNQVLPPGSEFPQFPSFAHDVALSLKNAVLVDQVVHRYKDGRDLMNLLREHIQKNIVCYGDKCYLQTQGIAQGSKVSTLLCSLHYGHMEGNVLSVLKDTSDQHILLRMTDDFLYISTSEANATAFVKAMYTGHPEYGCFVNLTKTKVNFPITIDGQQLCHYSSPDKGGMIPWCGLLINCATLEVMADYTKFTGMSVADTLTVERFKHPGQALKKKMMLSVMNNCKALLLDLNINSMETALLNIYQNFLACAIKFHCHIQALPKAGRVGHNPTFFFGVIKEIVSYVHMLIKSATNRAKDAKPLPNPLTQAINWLGFTAFHRVLQRKESSYRQLLPLLAKELKTELKGLHICESLAFAIDPQNSRVFAALHY